MTTPTCSMIAGPNGAGKTTFALTYLRESIDCDNFVNADLIAAGLSPLAPAKEAVAAGRLFLAEIERFVKRRESFAFETTLSGRSYLRLISRLKTDDWVVNLVYLWLPSIEHCQKRVRERVLSGGHNIPDDVIARRYPRSVSLLLNDYSSLCDNTSCWDNSGAEPVCIFTQSKHERKVEDAGLYEQLAGVVNP